ncbi:MAG: glycosyltransferase [Xanthomonadales bacterium]|nr:glycosyltransferase [Xanthomonadales bacterium]
MPAPETITLLHRPLPVERGETLPLTRRLRAAGCTVHQVEDGAHDLRATDLLWIQANPNLFPRALAALRSLPAVERPRVLLWFSEPLPMPRAAQLTPASLTLREHAKRWLSDPRTNDVASNLASLESLRDEGLVDIWAVSTPARQALLREHGIEAGLVPLGYEPGRDGKLLATPRDIDVLFLGEVVPRRRALLRSLEQRGLCVAVRGSWYDTDCWGDARTRLLNRTRVFLNLARHPGELPGYRFILGMANGCLVASEPVYLPGWFQPGVHYLEAPVDTLATSIIDVLDDEPRRAALASTGTRLVQTTLTLERSVHELLAMLE